MRRFLGYPLILVLLVSCLLVYSHCTSSKSPTPVTFTTGSATIDCSSFGTGTEHCSYEYAYNPTQCASHGCRKLLIYFAGDTMTCDNIALAAYAADGYVATCAKLFDTSTGAETYPYNREAARVNALVTTIVADTTVTANWSGEYLFFSGTGHGATAPVIAMARTTDANQASWKGTAHTAACFMAGAYDMVALDGMAGADGCTLSTSGVILPHEVVVGRYTGSLYLGGHECGSGPCPCSPAHSADVDHDSIIGSFTVTDLAITDWNLGACGDSLDPCTQQGVPSVSISTLCGLIDSSGGYTCTYQSQPTVPYSSCSVSYCQTWFNTFAP